MRRSGARGRRDVAKRSTIDLRERAATAVLALIVMASALALGTIHTEVLVICAITATAAALAMTSKLDTMTLPPSAKIVFYVIVGLTAWTAFQLVPLPTRLLGWIAGENADVWNRCLSPLKEGGPSFAPLSVDPVATGVQVLRGLTYLAVFLAALPVVARREGQILLQRIVVVATATMAAAAVAHPALSIDRIFLVYEPKETYSYDPAHLAPLLNTNHLAAYVNIGALISLAAVFEQGDDRVLPRPIAGALALLLGALTVWTGSRGGFATLVMGSVLVTVLSLRRRGQIRRVLKTDSLASALGVIGAASIFLLSAFDITRSKLSQNNLSKLALAKKAFGLLTDYGVFGAGRGTFESVFPRIREGDDYVVFTHPENILVQWTTEWGVPVALAAMIALVIALRPQRVMRGEAPPIGPWAAIVAVVVHNLVDFSMEIPGVMIALTICAAIVTGRSSSALQDESAVSDRARPLFRVGATASVAVFVMLALLRSDVELRNEQRTFTALGLNRSVTRDQFHARARPALLRHPAEPYFPFVGAVRAAAAHDESVLPWAARALERSPTYGRVHLLLGRALQPKHRAQARLEYRIACAQDSLACAVPETLPLVATFDDAIELVPDGERGLLVLDFLANGLLPSLPSTSVRIDAELRSRSASALGPVRRVALSAQSDLANAESWCADALRDECIAEGTRATRILVTLAPQTCESYELAANFRRFGGDTNGGFEELDGAVPLVEDKANCVVRLLDYARATGDDTLVTKAIIRMENVSCAKPEECAVNLVNAARAEAARGNQKHSLVLLTKARELNDNDQLLDEIGATAEAQGLPGQAVEAYSTLALRHPDEPKWKDKLDRARAALAAQRFQPPR